MKEYIYINVYKRRFKKFNELTKLKSKEVKTVKGYRLKVKSKR